MFKGTVCVGDKSEEFENTNDTREIVRRLIDEQKGVEKRG